MEPRLIAGCRGQCPRRRCFVNGSRTPKGIKESDGCTSPKEQRYSEYLAGVATVTATSRSPYQKFSTRPESCLDSALRNASELHLAPAHCGLKAKGTGERGLPSESRVRADTSLCARPSV